MAFNDDMDRYMHSRNRQSRVITQGPGWWERTFFPVKKSEEYTPEEMAKVTAMEQDIKKGEERLEDSHDSHEHEELEEKQEQRVSMYQKFLGMFKVEKRMEDDYAEISGDQLHPTQPRAVANDPAVTADFKKLAQIQMGLFERMPTRIKEEFRDSEDFEAYKEILSRRGVLKK